MTNKLTEEKENALTNKLTEVKVTERPADGCFDVNFVFGKERMDGVAMPKGFTREQVAQRLRDFADIVLSRVSPAVKPPA